MRARGFVVLTVIGTIGLVVTSAPALATFPGTDGRIAFASDRAGDLDIWSMSSDGSGVSNLTASPSAPGFDLEPDWSPGGTKIAFRSGSGDDGEIYTMNADGTELTRLTSNSFKDYSPAWSPDGSMIAFASNRNDPNFASCTSLSGCNFDVFVMPASGGSPVQVTFGSGSDAFPQFSPDGSLIVYDSDESGAFALYTVDLGTLVVTKLTPDRLRAGDPDFSPDGTKLAFANNVCTSTKEKDCKSDIFVMNIDGGSVHRLTRKFGNNHHPTWSPGGDKIVFSHGSLGGKPQQIYTMNTDGTGRTRLTQTNDNFVPDWGSV